MLSCTITAEIAAVEPLAAEVQAALSDYPELAFAVNVCLEELIINTFVHGLHSKPGHQIHVDIWIEERELVIQLRDDAPPFDPFSRGPVNSLDLAASERPIGGLGIHLVKNLMDSVDWQDLQPGNCITLRKVLAKTSGDDAGG